MRAGGRHLAVVVPLHPAPAVTLPQAGPVDHAADLPRLARWYRERCEATFKRGGGKRSPTTTGHYASALAFLVEHGRYQPRRPPAGGPRARAGPDPALRRPGDWAERDRPGPAAGGPRVDEPAHRAAREHRPARLPPAPQLVPEVVVERTIEAFAGVVRAMPHAAHRRGKIPYLPWTPAVDDEVTRAPAVHYTTRTVLSREQVGAAVAAMRALWLTSSTVAGHPVCVSGARFAAMVWLAGRLGLRPEETIAPGPLGRPRRRRPPRRAALGRGLPPRPGVGRARVQVPLKHRQPGGIRVVRPEPEDSEEFRRVMGGHRAEFVTPSAAGNADAHFFTTYRGLPIDLGNWTPR